MVFLRVLTLVLAGYPLYQDEQERFVCNTIQPGCANVCYDLYAPVSLFRFWLVQLATLCLPYVILVVYIVHKVSDDLHARLLTPPGHSRASPLLQIQREPFGRAPGDETVAQRGAARRFTGAYILHLMFRTLLEAGFGAAHYYLFGFYIPRRFLCQHPPCTTQVDCYVSRPTEKSVMLLFMLGVAALSLLLNVLDFINSIKRSVTRKGRKRRMAEEVYDEEPNSLVTPDLGGGAAEAGSFRRRGNSKGSCGGAPPPADPSSLHCPSSFPRSLGPQGCNSNGNNVYSAPQEDDNGSSVALCPPPESVSGTPRSIRVSKQGRSKPPPPPRRDLGSSPRPPGDAAPVCTRRVVQVTPGEDGLDKRSEWV